ncbi:TetR family transcriptional regulator [Streptomyces sp. CC219B]|uniref:TetR/AcrR family transcriptional regulator n=1 Tax=Streptomyces sp. CC219B TaxID=3044574 RepID=UPI0024A8B3D5|nr:TetR family transcriptional regulator [Streptomyces sp. CC219B]
MQIARAAAGLFARQGLRATRAEDIAQAAGIAPRTFYRYFATKEEAVAPLYAAGAERWMRALHEAPAELTVPEALELAVRHTLTPGAGVSAASWEWVRTLIRLAGSSPALGKVWAEVCHASERNLAGVLAGRLGQGSVDNVARSAAGVGGAGGVGASGGSGGAGASGGSGGAGASGGSGSAGGAGGGGGVAGVPGVADVAGVADGVSAALAPELRFAAATASAAVRVAVEAWAAGEARPEGPDGPAALALRNLSALRDFPWGEVTGASRG